MEAVSKTLYIPLYAKAYVTDLGCILCDPHARRIWQQQGFQLKGKARSKWLAYYMAMRAAVYDRWLTQQLERNPDAVVLHLGCGLDSRIHRVEPKGKAWYDVDLPQVIRERKRHFREEENYRMIGTDVCAAGWLDSLPGGDAVVVMEGLSMYLKPEALRALTEALAAHFDRVHLLMDCYSEFAARASRFKNPIREVGVTQVYGMDDPRVLDTLEWIGEKDMTPEELIAQLPAGEKKQFRKLYAGRMARKLYRMYEYRT